MTDQHPITPPPELVQEWKRTAPHQSNEHEHYHYITLCAAQWGADQELDACCDWMSECTVGCPNELRTARRPKPPSLKRVALLQLDTLNADLGLGGKGVDLSQIRRALEALPND